MSAGSTELYIHLRKIRAAYQNLRDAAWRHFERHQFLPTEFEAITQYLHILLDNVAQGLLFIDKEGRILTYNKQAETLLKIPVDQVVFKTFWNLFADDLFGFSVKNALKTGQTLENRTISLNGTTTLSVDFRTVDTETVQGGLLLIQDVTELHHWQQIADRHDRLQELGEMVGMVAHEIRNPLGGIQGFASLLAKDLEKNPEQQKLASAIVSGTADLNELVTAILNYARPLEPHFEEVDLAQFLEDLKKQILADQKLDPGIELLFNCPPGLKTHFDPHLMKSALLNLLMNAIQAMPNGGTVRLTANQNNDCLEISVRDEGIGISAENMDKLYSPFFTTRSSGNGFGLAEVQKIVQAHQGEINCTSTVGIGTTFRIKLWPLKKS